MCRLLAVVANQPVDLRFSLERFQKAHAQRNPDGWGVGWWEPTGQPRCEKEPSSAAASGTYADTIARARAPVFICHVRKATCGANTRANTHPFIHDDWMFAHNGCVSRDALLQRLDARYREALQGETDSEVYFLWILQNVAAAEDPIAGIAMALREVRRSRYTGLNFLLSDGRDVYAYREAATDQDDYSLFYLERDPGRSPHLAVSSRQTSALLEIKLALGERAVLVCSEPLTRDEEWKALEPGQLLRVSHPELRVTVATVEA